MTNKLEVIAVENSLGVVLPPDILERLGVKNGDTLFVTETPNGIELRAHDEEFAADMAAAERVVRENWELLRRLTQ